MNISVLTPEKELFNGKGTSVNVPGSTGQFQVLNNHAPIVSSLAAGEVVIIKENGEKLTFHIKSGFLEMLNNNVSLLLQGVA